MTGGHAAYIWPKTIQIFMTFLRRRSDFVTHKWDFGAQKRRFKILKRRFCHTLSETRCKSMDYKTAGKMVKNFDILYGLSEEFSRH